MDLFEIEKRLMIISIMYGGREGLAKFESAINKKNESSVEVSRCLTNEEMTQVLLDIGMSLPKAVDCVYEIIMED